MAIRYIRKDFVFDNASWSVAITDAIDGVGLDELAVMCGVSRTTLLNWKNNAHEGRDFNHPAMGNFLRVCNMLDLDPRHYFQTEC